MQRIFVGDIQGCAEELDLLLDRARSAFGDDFELWSVGDLINRGPDNLRVLNQFRDLVEGGRGRLVLGNHELGLLRISAGLRTPSPRDTCTDILSSSHCDEWIEWLRRQPLVATGSLAHVGTPVVDSTSRVIRRFAMVHASVHPDWCLAELERRARCAEARLSDPDPSEWRTFLSSRKDPDFETMERLVHCRSVPASAATTDSQLWSSSPPDAQADEATADLIAWHEAWSAKGHDYGIVYGHWALQGLHVAENLRGLDTGCVHHGRGHDGALTAWLPDANSATPFATPDDHFWQVPARRAYYREWIREMG